MILLVLLLRLPIGVSRLRKNKRFNEITSKHGLDKIRYIRKYPDSKKENYYIYKVKAFGIPFEKLDTCRDSLKYALRVSFYGGSTNGKRGYTLIRGKPFKFKEEFFK
jgi:hypothetical protein